jgi:hypothetical protein
MRELQIQWGDLGDPSSNVQTLYVQSAEVLSRLSRALTAKTRATMYSIHQRITPTISNPKEKYLVVIHKFNRAM